VPRAIVINVIINELPACALVDTGSLSDFMSTKFADQLKAPLLKLEKPMSVQLAVTGSRSTINTCVNANFRFQGIDENRRFDIMNIENYDLILGTPFLFQHKVALAFNPSLLSVGSGNSLPIEGENVSVIPSRAANVAE
ncbi:hypothetical protein M407DRAFT_49589, partial [Tulasnella calospora MUT 4182]